MDTHVGRSDNPRLRDLACLITGGLGFIGSNLARTLVAAGARVTIIDDLDPLQSGSHRNIDGIEDRVRVVTADLRDATELGSFVTGHDLVFDLAGRSGHADSMVDPLGDLDVNARARVRLLEACRVAAPSARLVFTSTRQVYGRPLRTPVDEDHPVRPVDVNGVSKLAAEHLYAVYSGAYGLHTTVLRISNTYGPRMRVRDARQTFLGAWISAVLHDEPIEVWGGTQRRDLVYVDDVVRAILLAGTAHEAIGQTFNVSGSEALALEDLAMLLIDLFGRGHYEIRPFPPEREHIDVGDLVTDASRIRRALGWHPVVTLREGLAQTLAFYREHPEFFDG